jgi:hypothetical protein
MTYAQAIFIALALVFSSALGFLIPMPAQCAWCGTVPCYDHYGCSPGCVCLKQGGQLRGSCASFE